ncbi:unnamed protein product [Sphagnum balticum]
MQRARDRKRKRDSATWHSLHERDDDLTLPDPTKPRVVSYVAAENESNHKKKISVLFRPPTYFRADILNASDWRNFQKVQTWTNGKAG